MAAEGSRLFEVSDQAQAYLESVGCSRVTEPSWPAIVRENLAGTDEDLVEAVVAFEERFGGITIDAQNRKLELGICQLLSRSIAMEVVNEPKLVLFGTEEHSDIYLAQNGWIWQQGPDRVIGELATSLEKYIERMATNAPPPWQEAGLRLVTAPMVEDITRALRLASDPVVSDATYLLAASERHELRARLLGTPYQRSSMELFCRDYAALVEALTACARIPGFHGVVSALHSSITDQRIKLDDAPEVAALEASLGETSTLRVPSARGGATHLLGDGSIGAYELDEEGSLSTSLTLNRDGGVFREYYVPWPD